MRMTEVIENKMHNKKDSVRLALLEQQNYFTNASLEKLEIILGSIHVTIEKNNEKINHKIEKLETKIEGRIKWLFNNIIMVFFSSTGLALTAYEIWRKF